MQPTFIPLRTFTTYSLAEGAIKCEELVELCRKYKYPAVGITERNNMFSSLEVSQLLAKNGIQPLMGVSFSVLRPGAATSANYDELVLFAQNQAGYRNLMRLASLAYENVNAGGMAHLTLAQIKELSQNLICLTGGVRGGLVQLLSHNQHAAAEQYLQQLIAIFAANLYIEITRHNLPEERASEEHLLGLASQYKVPLVATNYAFYPKALMHEAHDALLCIANSTYVAEEARPHSCPEFYFKSPREMSKLFADLPDALANSVVVAKRCAVMAEGREPMLPRFLADNVESEEEYLVRLAEEGLRSRLQAYAGKKEIDEQKYFDRLHYELSVITSMRFAGYFLIVSDFIKFSKRQGIPVGPGRGSGAGSVVAWALEITDLDPIRFGLLFERFLNPERVSMPDFDIDFCQYRRDEVIAYVQQKYGPDRVAHIITFGKMQARAVLRDVGRVLQLPYGQVDRICKLVPNNPAQPVTLAEAIHIEPLLKEAIQQDSAVKHMVDISLQLEGLYRHASTHAAGVVISDQPIENIVPLYWDGKSAIRALQYTMSYAEAAGLIKFDFLGLKTLTMIDQCCQMIRASGVPIEVSALDFTDPLTYQMLSRGEAVGVFQFESKGMREALKKLRPDCIEDLIALGALYRPGPMDNIPSYIARKHGEQAVELLHPSLEAVLKETFGVIIYQEQVMEIARTLAGYTLGSADLLRKAMGKKIKSEMDAQREIFVSGAIGRGVEAAQAGQIFDLVAKFAGYGFNKAHATAYAVISYQTAYLRANFPAQFLAASMNIEINDTDTLATFAQEAATMQVKIAPPNIQASQSYFSVAPDNVTVLYGLGAIKNIGLQAIEQVVAERNTNGPFVDFYDFMQRAGQKHLNKRQLEQLVKAGAFDCLETNRPFLIALLEPTIRTIEAENRPEHRTQMQLFKVANNTDVLANIKRGLPIPAPWSKQDQLVHEAEAIGFYLTGHPLARYVDLLPLLKASPLAELATSESAVNMTVVVLAEDLRIRTSPRGRFGFLRASDGNDTIDVALFSEELLDEVRPFLGTNLPLVIEAQLKLDQKTGNMRIIAQRLAGLNSYVGEKLGSINLYATSNETVADIAQRTQTAMADDGIALILHIQVQGAGEVQLRVPGKVAIETALQLMHDYGTLHSSSAIHHLV